MNNILYIGIGGFFGAIARWGLSGLPYKWLDSIFPWGTLLVNVLGCLLIGALMFLVEDRRMLAPQAQMLLITGFLGSLTTFSTFGYETMRLMDNGIGAMLANIGANCALGLAAVWLGWNAARLAA
jgi:CrcB protein